MLYFLPDSRDAVDPTFDFEHESRSPDRLARNDLYCHEVLERPCDGLLVSYAMIKKGIYPAAAVRRLLRSGVREFFRAPAWMQFMGDPGAFSYVGEEEPPVTVSEVAEFYGTTGIDLGLSVDHIVVGYSDSDGLFASPDAEDKRRYDLTIALARDFIAASEPYHYTPVGVVQGWSPESMAKAAAELQRMGYRYLAIGGLVKRRTEQVLRILAAVDSVRQPDTKLHLLGVTRPGNVSEYVARGVASIDSTSPLRRAWMDARHNYHLDGETYCALRIPQSISGRIRSKILAGEINGDAARKAEERTLAAVADFDRGAATMESTLESLLEYQAIHSPTDNREADYRRTLEARPWKRCRCEVCSKLGHHVILLRGADRNRSRGFHNVGQFYRGMLRELGEPDLVLVGCGFAKRKEPSPAWDLYTGPVVAAHKKLAERYRSPKRILSGLHGLLHPKRITQPYDATVVDAPAAERAAWGTMVIEQIREIVPPSGRVVALAGADYLGWTKAIEGIQVEQPLAGKTLGQRLEIAAALDQPARVRPLRTGVPIRWDFFWTTFRSSLGTGEAFVEHWTHNPARSASLELPEDTPLDEAIAAAREAGFFGKGTAKTGVFEVQNDHGVYWAPEGFLNIGQAKPERVRFITWDELEAAEARGEDDLSTCDVGRILASTMEHAA